MSFSDEKDEEQDLIRRIARWLKRKGNYFALNRNLGPYSNDLAAALLDGSWEKDSETSEEPVTNFGFVEPS